MWAEGLLGGIAGVSQGVVDISDARLKELANDAKTRAQEALEMRLADKKFGQQKETTIQASELAEAAKIAADRRGLAYISDDMKSIISTDDYSALPPDQQANFRHIKVAELEAAAKKQENEEKKTEILQQKADASDKMAQAALVRAERQPAEKTQKVEIFQGSDGKIYTAAEAADGSIPEGVTISKIGTPGKAKESGEKMPAAVAAKLFEKAEKQAKNEAGEKAGAWSSKADFPEDGSEEKFVDRRTLEIYNQMIGKEGAVSPPAAESKTTQEKPSGDEMLAKITAAVAALAERRAGLAVNQGTTDKSVKKPTQEQPAQKPGLVAPVAPQPEQKAEAPRKDADFSGSTDPARAIARAVKEVYGDLTDKVAADKMARARAIAMKLIEARRRNIRIDLMLDQRDKAELQEFMEDGIDLNALVQ